MYKELAGDTMTLRLEPAGYGEWLSHR